MARSKRSGSGGIGTPVGVPAKHGFANPEEVADRRNTGDSPPQQDMAPHFSQIAPARTAKSLIDPEITHYDSPLKFAPSFREG